MATSHVNAMQVGSYFVGQYYKILQTQPELVHQFYNEGSSITRVDGDLTDSASEMLQIHTLITSLKFSVIEIKTINSLNSWNGGLLVMVSGAVKTTDFNDRRKFMQTFFLAPQDTGFFVLNDIFQFIDEETIYQDQASVPQENQYDSQLNASNHLPEPPVSDYALEEEATEYVNSVHVEDDPIDKYSLPEEQHQQDPEPEYEVVETPAEEFSASYQSPANVVHEPVAAAIEEPVAEPPKKTYASILRAAKVAPPSNHRTSPPASDWHYTPQPTGLQSDSEWSYATESGVQVNTTSPPASEWHYTPQPTGLQSNSEMSFALESGVEAAEGSATLDDEGESRSVYVRNLSPTVTSADIEKEFKNFGRIVPDGIFLRNRKEIGVCYAFVEFEEALGVQNAIKASPIQLAGRQVYIEERRANSTGASRGGGRRGGRGRSSYPSEAPRGRSGGRSYGRDGDYNRGRGNGFQSRGSRQGY